MRDTRTKAEVRFSREFALKQRDRSFRRSLSLRNCREKKRCVETVVANVIYKYKNLVIYKYKNIEMRRKRKKRCYSENINSYCVNKENNLKHLSLF